MLRKRTPEYIDEENKIAIEILARNILKRLREHEANLGAIGRRWPFELLQNAHDPGPRSGSETVQLWFIEQGTSFRFEHDGKSFKMKDLVALNHGGSSKDFDGDNTVGRFGTGFLSTHVLSRQVRVEGLLKGKESGYDKFTVELDRPDDMGRVIENIEACRSALDRLEVIEDADKIRTARFTYHQINQKPLRDGLERFNETLPYLYATCPRLGIVYLDSESTKGMWCRQRREVYDFQGGIVEDTLLKVLKEGETETQFRILRIRQRSTSRSSLLVLLLKTGIDWEVFIPPQHFPRIFVQEPLSRTSYIPLNSIIEGQQLNTTEARDRLLMTERDHELLKDALNALPIIVQRAQKEDWQNSHLLARLGRTELLHGTETDEEEKEWWDNEMLHVAKRLSQLPLIQTRHGFLPAIAKQAGDLKVDFIFPKFSLTSNTEISLVRVWSLVDETENLNPPIENLARDWLKIAQGWHDLGVTLSRVSLTELSKEVKIDVDTVDDLKVRVDPRLWLAKFIDVLGEIESVSTDNVIPLLEDLLPDQNGRLKSPSTLHRDRGIPKGLKDIAVGIGIDVRAQLLDQQLIEIGNESSLIHFGKSITSYVSKEKTEEEVVEACIRQLNQRLPEGKQISEFAEPEFAALTSSIRFLDYLWKTRGVEGSSQARECPFISLEQKVERVGPSKQIMAPVPTWKADAQPFFRAYPPQRVLSPAYYYESDGTVNIVPHLVQWGIAIADPLIKEHTASTLEPKHLKALTEANTDVENVTVRQEEVGFSQIALLPKELIQRCQGSKELAKDLLGLVLKYVAPNDSKWKSYREITGYRERVPVTIRVREALWIVDLTSRPWIPVPKPVSDDGDSDDKDEIRMASAVTLKEQKLINPEWLRDNDDAIDLLSEFFGFGALELRLLATPNSKDLEYELSKMVQQLGSDPAEYATLRAQIEERQRLAREKERNRSFGLAVQDAVEGYLRAQGLNVTLVDCGFDLEVEVLDCGAFKLGSYLLEIKATTTGEVRLTPKQAETASKENERFVLCVVDLQEVLQDRLTQPWHASDIVPLASIVTNIGKHAEETRTLVEWAQASEIGIRNAKELRYAVPLTLWQEGITIQEWVIQLAPHLSEVTEAE